MTYAELIKETETLRKLVDALCVALLETQKDINEERIRLGLRSPASIRGFRLLRDAIGQAAFDELEHQRKILIEDYPNLKVKK